MASFLDAISGLSFSVATIKVVGLALFVLAAAVALALLARRSRLMMPGRQRLLLVAVTLVTLVLLAVSVAGLSYTKQEKKLGVVLLVDGSASIPDGEFDRARQWVAQAYGLAKTEFVRTIVFGRDPEVLPNAAAGAPAIERPEQQPGSHLERALHAAIDLFPENITRRAVLLSDGNQTAGDLAAEASLAAAHGVELSTVMLDTRDDRDLYIESIDIPAAARPGERVKVGVVVVANFAAAARLNITQGGKSVFNETVNIAPGRNAFEAESTVSGVNAATFSAQIDAADDQHPDNNRLAATIRIAARPSVILFGDNVDADLALVEALNDAGLSVNVAAADKIPTSLGSLLGYDEVILSDLKYKQLSDRQQQTLLDYAKTGGGGVLVIGGPNSGDLGKKKEKLPIKRMMPVVFKEKKKTEPNPVTLILVIDKSASMARQRKFAMAIQAAADTIDLLNERSRLGVILFDDFPRWAIPLQKVGKEENKEKLKQRLRSFGVDGGTSIYPAVSEAYKKLKDDKAKVKHIILLSDGISITTFDQWGHVIQWMASKKITISTVALGQESDRKHLHKIAEVGRGRFYYTEDFTQIPRIFLEETKTIAKTNVVEKKIKPTLLKKGDLLDGLNLQTIPEIVGYNSSEPKPTSEVFVTADRNEPLLVRWRYGLGRVSVLATDSGGRWATGWRNWNQYGPLMTKLVRGTLADLALRNYRITADAEDDQARLAVDVTDQYGNFINDLNLVVHVARPAGGEDDGPLEVPLSQVRAGGYEGTFTVGSFGTHSLRVEPQGGALARAQGIGQVHLTPPREFVATQPDRALLSKVATIGRGKFNPQPQDIFVEPEMEYPQRQALWNYLLYVALGMMLVAIIIRRS